MRGLLAATPDPRWGPMPYAGFLTVVAGRDSSTSEGARAIFLAACKSDAATNGGLVSVNRVRRLLSDSEFEIEPRLFSALWSVYTGPGRPMEVVGYELCVGSTSRNDGKPYKVRRWTAQLHAD